MSPEKVIGAKKFLPYLKDVAYVIGILISLYGWINSKSKNAAVLETTIKYNTEAVKKLDDFVTIQVNLNSKQAEINGTLMEFKNSHSN